MDVEALRSRLADPGIQLVDVRLPNEWEAGHLPGAVHIQSDYLYDRLGELDRDRLVLAVCRTGSRSATAVEILQSEGFRSENLDGGLTAWVDSGGQLVGTHGEAGYIVDPEAPPDDRPEHVRALEASFLDALFSVQEYFGDEEATEDEIREFLKNRLIGEGKTPEEADRILDGKAL